MKRIVILASGRGSNAQAILRAVRAGHLRAEVAGVFSDRAEAPVLEWATQMGLPCGAEVPVRGESREQFDQRLWERFVRALEPDWIVLAGYMRILSGFWLSKMAAGDGSARIINVHPSLLPAFPGLDAYGQAFRAGVRETGVTVHGVDAGLDTGPIFAQESFSIADCRDVKEVEMRGLAVEHRLYPATLEWVLNGRKSVCTS